MGKDEIPFYKIMTETFPSISEAENRIPQGVNHTLQGNPDKGFFLTIDQNPQGIHVIELPNVKPAEIFAKIDGIRQQAGWVLGIEYHGGVLKLIVQ